MDSIFIKNVDRIYRIYKIFFAALRKRAAKPNAPKAQKLASSDEILLRNILLIRSSDKMGRLIFSQS
jgi:hypothetical protein